jgi:hypothetical protein
MIATLPSNPTSDIHSSSVLYLPSTRIRTGDAAETKQQIAQR